MLRICNICYSYVCLGMEEGICLIQYLDQCGYNPRWVQWWVQHWAGARWVERTVSRDSQIAQESQTLGWKKNFASHKTLASQKNLWKKQYKYNEIFQYNCKHKNTHFPILSRVAWQLESLTVPNASHFVNVESFSNIQLMQQQIHTTLRALTLDLKYCAIAHNLLISKAPNMRSSSTDIKAAAHAR